MCTLDTINNPLIRELIGSMIGLARASDCNSLTDSNTWKILAEGLVATIPGQERSEIHSDASLPNNDQQESGPADSLSVAHLRSMIQTVQAEKHRLVPDCAVCTSPCPRNANVPREQLFTEEEPIRDLKLQIFHGIQTLAVKILPSMEAGDDCSEQGFLLAKGLFAIGENWNEEQLTMIVTELSHQKANS